MENSIKLEKDTARVLDILEQVRKLNTMILMHKTESGNRLMANQYTDLKNRFLIELKDILTGFEIEVIVGNQAA